MGKALYALVFNLHAVVSGDKVDVSNGEGENDDGKEPPEVGVGFCNDDRLCGRREET
jgi:hypothetical protein